MLNEKFNIPSFTYYNDKFNELKSQFLEMGQLKSDFDMEKFTTKKEGHFLAHQFHFLMRQYHLALYEARRMTLDRDEKLRKLKELQDKLDAGEIKCMVTGMNGQEEKYIDIEISRELNNIDLLEIDMVNKINMCDHMEKLRNFLIEKNGGPFTNAQYQAEEPAYWKWFLERKALWQHKQKVTGIHEGVWENVDYLESLPALNPNFQVKMLAMDGGLDLAKIEIEMELADKQFPERIQSLITSSNEFLAESNNQKPKNGMLKKMLSIINK